MNRNKYNTYIQCSFLSLKLNTPYYLRLLIIELLFNLNKNNMNINLYYTEKNNHKYRRNVIFYGICFVLKTSSYIASETGTE